MNTLDRIVESTHREVRRRREQVPLSELEKHLSGRGEDRPFSEALTRPGVSVIAEYKRRSPSAGEIRAGAAVADVVTAYERAGAAALSVLTEGPHFAGALEDLEAAKGATRLPVLRKDFIVDLYQVYESAVAGADAILLIVAAVGQPELAELHREAVALDLDVLVEVHDEAELTCALEVIDADIIGINNRDLTTLQVDQATTERLLPEVPTGKTVVAESGYRDREELLELERIGVDAVLIGESLMRAPDPEEALRAILPDQLL